MFRQTNQNSPAPPATEPQPHRSSRRKLYAAISAAIVVIILIAGVILVPPGRLMDLSLNYSVGEHMVYQTTNIITNYSENSTLESQPGGLSDLVSVQSVNSTTTLDVVALKGNVYTVNMTEVNQPNLVHLPTLPLNVSKDSFYSNFIAPGYPQIFNNNTDPKVLAYLAQTSVKVGDVWTIPVSTGNSSLSYTGTVTITFTGIQEINVPAGSYKVMRIDITSDTWHINSDGTGISAILKLPQGMTTQFNGTTYLEQSTCRLIKSTITEETTANVDGVDRISTMYTEQTLVEHTKP
jgi:hypothetical protein